MKVVYKENEKVILEDLKRGDVFKDGNSYYMVVDSPHTDTEYYTAAVNLTGFNLHELDNESFVTLVPAELVIG